MPLLLLISKNNQVIAESEDDIKSGRIHNPKWLSKNNRKLDRIIKAVFWTTPTMKDLEKVTRLMHFYMVLKGDRNSY